MQISTFRTLFGHNKSKNQHRIFGLFLTSEMSQLHVGLKSFTKTFSTARKVDSCVNIPVLV